MLSNEVLFFIVLFSFLSFSMVFYKLGMNYLQGFLVISYIITVCITSKFFDFFGMQASVGAITYAGIFLATDVMTEKYGKEFGYQTIRISFAVGIVFTAITQLTLLFAPVAMSTEMAEAMQTVFGATLRLLAAGYFTYIIAQHFDVWFFHRISIWTRGRHLWLRNNLSTITSQIIDSLLFFTLAFYGTMPNDVFVEILLVGMYLKILIAILDTPFIYLSKKIKPLS